MTTVAWDGKTLAADRQLTVGSSVFGQTTKIAKRKDGALCGIGGVMCLSSAYMRWFLKGEKGQEPTLRPDNNDDSGRVLIIRKDGTVEDHDRDGWHTLEGPAAIGSGGTLASLAMDMGAKAEEAVKRAAMYDIFTGSEVDTLELSK